MAHPKETRDRLRQLYVSGNQTLETAAIMCGTTQATARRWREQARENGDDWDKMRAAYTLAGGSIEELGQQDGDLGPAEKVKLLASLADAYNKTVAANARILPETSKLATALEVVELLVQFVSEKHPKQLGALAEVLEPFGAEVERKFG